MIQILKKKEMIEWIVFHLFVTGSLHSLINNTLHLVSNKLLGMWKNDLNSSLAALELLASLAKLRLTDQSASTIH